MNQKGGLLVFVFLLLAFVLLLAIPALQLAVLQHRISINEQQDLQTFYLAEAGLRYAREQMQLDPFCPLPQEAQPWGMGAWRVWRSTDAEGVHWLLSSGILSESGSQVEFQLGDRYEHIVLTANQVLCLVGSVPGSGGLTFHGPGQVNVVGSALVDGSIECDVDMDGTAYVDVNPGPLSVTGIISEQVDLAAEPLTEMPDDFSPDMLWAFLGDQLQRPGRELDGMQDGVVDLTSGTVYTYAGDKCRLAVRGPDRDDQPAATLIVRGDLVLQQCSGRVNLLVEGDLVQEAGADEDLNVQGIVYVGGNMHIKTMHIQGALIASRIHLQSAGLHEKSRLHVEPSPAAGEKKGLVVPKFMQWADRR